MPNTLVETASPYTSWKCIKIISQVIPVYSHSNVQGALIEGTVPVHTCMAKFGCPLPGVHMLYELQTAPAHVLELAEHCGANG